MVGTCQGAPRIIAGMAEAWALSSFGASLGYAGVAGEREEKSEEREGWEPERPGGGRALWSVSPAPWPLPF